MPNLLVPNIDTSGVREADLQARQGFRMGQAGQRLKLGNLLLSRQIERLPELEAMETEAHNLKMEQDNLDLLKARVAIATDILPQVDQDSWPEYLQFLDEIGLGSQMMKAPEEVKAMKPKDFEKFKINSMSDAKDFLTMNLEQFKAKQAEELAKQKAKQESALEKEKHGYRTAEEEQKHRNKLKELEKGGGSGKDFKASDSNAIAKKVDKYLINPITGIPDLPTDVAEDEYLQAVSQLKDKRAMIEATAERIYKDTNATHGEAVVRAIIELSKTKPSEQKAAAPATDWRKYATGKNKLQLQKSH